MAGSDLLDGLAQGLDGPDTNRPRRSVPRPRSSPWRCVPPVSVPVTTVPAPARREHPVDPQAGSVPIGGGRCRGDQGVEGGTELVETLPAGRGDRHDRRRRQERAGHVVGHVETGELA